LLRRSVELAPSPAWQALALADKAVLGKHLGYGPSSSADIEAASKLAAEIDWEQTSGDERVGLLMLAEVLAPRNARLARNLLDRYWAIKRPMSSLRVFRSDRRLQAFEACSRGAVEIADGNARRAVGLLIEAFEVFRDVGYRHRAMSTAARISQLTGDQNFAAVAREYLAALPSGSSAPGLSGIGGFPAPRAQASAAPAFAKMVDLSAYRNKRAGAGTVRVGDALN
jgi:hypothetical protein